MVLTEKGQQTAAIAKARAQGKTSLVSTLKDTKRGWDESRQKQVTQAWGGALKYSETQAQYESALAGYEARATGMTAKEALSVWSKTYKEHPQRLPGEYPRLVQDIVSGKTAPWVTETDIPASTSTGGSGGIVETIINMISGGEGGWGSPAGDSGGSGGSADEDGILTQKNMLIGGAAIAAIVGIGALSRRKK